MRRILERSRSSKEKKAEPTAVVVITSALVAVQGAAAIVCPQIDCQMIMKYSLLQELDGIS